MENYFKNIESDHQKMKNSKNIVRNIMLKIQEKEKIQKWLYNFNEYFKLNMMSIFAKIYT